MNSPSTDNGQPGVFTLSRNSAWDNGDVGFAMDSSTATMVDNLAVSNNGGEIEFSGPGTQVSRGNTWQIAGPWNDAALRSTDSTTVKGPRQADGTVTGSNFLLPRNGAAVGATTNW
jgi:hypothetical protein